MALGQERKSVMAVGAKKFRAPTAITILPSSNHYSLNSAALPIIVACILPLYNFILLTNFLFVGLFGFDWLVWLVGWLVGQFAHFL